MEAKRVYSYGEAAEILGVSKSTIANLGKAGKLRVVYLSARTPRIPATAIQELLGESPATANHFDLGRQK